MKNVRDSYLKEHLKKALEQICPDKAEELWNQPLKKASGDEWFLDGLNRQSHRGEKIIRLISVSAACFAVCLFSYYMIALHTQASVYLDVNPGIQFELNSRKKVVSAEAANPEGETVLENLELKQKELNDAVNAVLESLVSHGYLNEEENLVLLSVDSSDRKKGNEIRKETAEEISRYMETLVGSSSVLDQEVYVDKELKELAQRYGITPGKATFIQKLAAENPKLKYEELAVLPLKELAERLSKDSIDLREYADYTGSGWESEEDLEEEKKEEKAEQKEEREEEKTEKVRDEKESGDKEKLLDPEEAIEKEDENQEQKHEISEPEYEAPELEYKAPEPEYEAPEPEYEAPEPEYEAPESEHEAPEPEYEAPEPEYEVPETEGDSEEEGD